MNNRELVAQIENQRNLMISVATGGPRIQDVNEEYKTRKTIIKKELNKRKLDDPNPYAGLWDWYGKWSSGDLETYKSRRAYLSKLYQSLIDLLNETTSIEGEQVFSTTDSLEGLKSKINEICIQLNNANTEDQFKAIGLLCRELLISLGQIVYKPEIHKDENDVEISNTDSKRMLLSYVSHALHGSSQETTRRFVKVTIALANNLTHNQTADFQRAALCLQATICLVNIIGILSGNIRIER